MRFDNWDLREQRLDYIGNFNKLIAVDLPIAIYGKRLAGTRAVEELETYIYRCENYWGKMGYSLFNPDAGPRKEFRHNDLLAERYHVAKLGLSMFREAMLKFDHEFFADFSEALLRRKDPAYADKFKVLDYLKHQTSRILRRKKGFQVQYDELKKVGVKNVSRVVAELGLEKYTKTHTDRRGKRRQKNTK